MTTVSYGSLSKQLLERDFKLEEGVVSTECVVLATRHGLSASSFAKEWEAFAFTQKVKEMDETAVNKFAAFLDNRALSKRGEKAQRKEGIVRTKKRGHPKTTSGSSFAAAYGRELPSDSFRTPKKEPKSRDPVSQKRKADFSSPPSIRKVKSYTSPSIQASPASKSPYMSRTNRNESLVVFNEALSPFDKAGSSTSRPSGAIEVRPLGLNEMPSSFRYMMDDENEKAQSMSLSLSVIYLFSCAVQFHVVCFASLFLTSRLPPYSLCLSLSPFSPSLSLPSGFEERLVKLRENIVDYASQQVGDTLTQTTVSSKLASLSATADSTSVKMETEDDDEEEKDDVEVSPLNVVSHSNQQRLYVGRVCTDNDGHKDGVLNKGSTMLEGDRSLSRGARVVFDLKELDSFSLFPGQLVAATGVNINGRHVFASKVLESPFAPQTLISGSDIIKYNTGLEKKPLSVCVAAGPYTLSTDLEYEPLKDLLHSVAVRKPDVLVLMGPFVDEDHKLIKKGDQLLASFDQIFKDRLDLILRELNYVDTKVVVVPAVNDMTNEPVLPQPAFPAHALDHNEKFTMLPNPGRLQVNDVVFNFCSLDIISRMSRAEKSEKCTGNRLTRLASHLFQQRSVYPIFPAIPGDAIDFTHYKDLEMKESPDIFISPSKLRTFVEPIKDNLTGTEVLTINPGTLTKSSAGGSYAMLSIHPLPVCIMFLLSIFFCSVCFLLLCVYFASGCFV